jgi:glutaredoxin
MSSTIIVYGADWCEDTQRSRRLLRRLGIAHHYVNIDEDLDALERAKALNSGQRRTPTIDFGGRALVEPTNPVLVDVLLERGHLTRDDVRERMAVQNVGDLERIVRASTGLLTMAAASRMPSVLRWPLTLAGAAVALTGVTGWCPGYSAAGVSSLGGPGDHPKESRRDTWVEPIVPRAPVGASR